MGEWHVVVCNVVEEVNLALVEEQTGCDRVDWRVTPSFVEETTILVKSIKEVDVGL